MIITVSNQKGGSCKTTTAALIALTLAVDGKDVLCIDCDPQGGLSSLFGTDFKTGIYEALMGEDVTPAETRGVRILTADHRLDKIAYTLPPFEIREILKKYTAEYVVIDTPPTVQGISRAAAIVADKCIIPADIARTTINPTLYTLDALKQIDKSGRVLFIGKEPKPDAKGYTARLFLEFKEAVKNQYAGLLPKSAGAQKAAAGLQRIPSTTAETVRSLCND